MAVTTALYEAVSYSHLLEDAEVMAGLVTTLLHISQWQVRKFRPLCHECSTHLEGQRFYMAARTGRQAYTWRCPKGFCMQRLKRACRLQV